LDRFDFFAGFGFLDFFNPFDRLDPARLFDGGAEA